MLDDVCDLLVPKVSMQASCKGEQEVVKIQESTDKDQKNFWALTTLASVIESIHVVDQINRCECASDELDKAK